MLGNLIGNCEISSQLVVLNCECIHDAVFYQQELLWLIVWYGELCDLAISENGLAFE